MLRCVLKVHATLSVSHFHQLDRVKGVYLLRVNLQECTFRPAQLAGHVAPHGRALKRAAAPSVRAPLAPAGQLHGSGELEVRRKLTTVLKASDNCRPKLCPSVRGAAACLYRPARAELGGL